MIKAIDPQSLATLHEAKSMITFSTVKHLQFSHKLAYGHKYLRSRSILYHASFISYAKEKNNEQHGGTGI